MLAYVNLKYVNKQMFENIWFQVPFGKVNTKGNGKNTKLGLKPVSFQLCLALRN